MEPNPGGKPMSALAPVREADQLDWATIETYLRAHRAARVDAPLRDVRQFTNGAANLTYLLRFGERELVLRRPPAGTIAPGAHDMRREWRVLSRLWRHFDRAPRAYLFCDDHTVTSNSSNTPSPSRYHNMLLFCGAAFFSGPFGFGASFG